MNKTIGEFEVSDRGIEKIIGIENYVGGAILLN